MPALSPASARIYQAVKSILKPFCRYKNLCKITFISICFPFFCFKSRFYHIHRFYPYRSFKHSNWWRV